MPPTAFFITGTDTSVGKTHISVSLVKALVKHGLRVAVMKPIASGSDRTPEGLRNADAVALAEASNVDVPYATLNPYCFEPPVSPHIAANEAKIPVNIDLIKENFTSLAHSSDVTVVEGAGGWYAPISDWQSMADLPIALNIPVVLVVGVRLGCLNHARLTKEAIEASGVKFAGWVANLIDPTLERPAENMATLQHLLGSEPLAVFPFASIAPSAPPQASATAAAHTPTPPAATHTPTPPLAAAHTAAANAPPPPPTQGPVAPATPAPTTPVPPLAHPNVRCGEHLARSLSLISF